MRRWSSSLEQWTIQRPRLWVPSPYSLSPTWRSKPAFQWQGTTERIHRQWQQGTKRTQDRHGVTNSLMGIHLPPLWQEGPCSFKNSPEKLLPSSVGICYCAWAYTLQYSLPKVSQAFKTAVLNRWPRACKIPKYFARTTSPHWDTIYINSGSMRQGDHFSQTKKKSEKPVIDIIDFK